MVIKAYSSYGYLVGHDGGDGAADLVVALHVGAVLALGKMEKSDNRNFDP